MNGSASCVGTFILLLLFRYSALLLTFAFVVVHLEVCPVLIVDTDVGPAAFAILEVRVVGTGVVHSVSRNVGRVRTNGNFCILETRFWSVAD